MAPRTPKTRFSTQPCTPLPGSDKPAFSGSEGEVRSSRASITVSVIVRRKAPLNPKTLGKQRLTRAQLRQQHGADPAAVKLVQAFAKEYGLTADLVSAETRVVSLTGAPAAMERAFGVRLTHHTSGGKTYRVRDGAIQLPGELQGAVTAVLGLDNRPQAKPHFRLAKDQPKEEGGHIIARASGTSYSPIDVATLYGLPSGSEATGETIGIIELGGGYRTADLQAYFKSLGRPAPKVTTVSVDQGKNQPSTADGADGEVMLDIEVASAVAPGAGIVVYFAPNTDQGFIDAIATAVHDTINKPSVISISWGGPESSWTQQALNALDQACQSAAAIGVTIVVACGDNGSTDGGTGNNVDFPASSPHVLACGGTRLVGANGTITSETVWNELSRNEGATGGGVSAYWAKPSWQSTANVPAPSGNGLFGQTGGRGVPDVCGNADPATGYTTRVDGQTLVIGGTSAVAPLWSGVIAVANAQNRAAAGFLNPLIYAGKAKPGFRDITEGSNGAFQAGPGWDACTGLGSPNLPGLLALLAPGGISPPKSKGKKTTSRGGR